MKTILLVGGFGTRLRPLTNSIAKPMVPLVNRPFTEYTLDLLKRHGLKDIIFSSFYLPEALQSYFGDGKDFGDHIDYCLEPEPRGTAGAIKNCEPYLDGETFLIFNGDVLTDLDLSEMIAMHRQKKALATIALGARFHTVVPVTAGTTLGMLAANVPAVLLGQEVIKRVPLGTVRLIAALLFVAIGLWLLAETAGLI